MQAARKDILKMKERFQETLEKETLTEKETALLRYVSEFITFRLRAIKGGNFLNTNLELKERKLLNYLSEKEIKELNLSILYRDIKKKEIRNESELKKIKEGVNKKAP